MEEPKKNRTQIYRDWLEKEREADRIGELNAEIRNTLKELADA